MTKRRRYVKVPQPSQIKSDKTQEKTRKVNSLLVRLNVLLISSFIAAALIVLFTQSDKEIHEIAHIIIVLLSGSFIQNMQTLVSWIKQFRKNKRK